MRIFLKILGFFCFMVVGMKLWEAASGWHLFWLYVAFIVNNLCEYLDGVNKGMEENEG